MTSVEQKLLACATLLKPDISQLEQRRLPVVEDMEAFIALAMKEGLAGLLYKNLRKSGLFNDLKNSQKQKLQTHYHQTVRLNLIRIDKLKKVLARIARTDIRVVLLQGVALIQDLYHEVGLRSMSDIDLWVLPKDYDKLVSILIEQGFGRDLVYPNTFREGLTVLDIHSHLFWADRIRSRQRLISRSQDEIYRKTRMISFEGEPARCLNRYDQVLYLGLHLLKHNAERLIWLADINNLVADWKISNWQALFARSRELGQEKGLAQTLFLMKRLLDFHLPEEVRSQAATLNPIEKKILRLRQKKESLPEWSTLILYSSGMGLFKGAVLVIETLFPRSEILRQVFADTPELNTFQLYTRRFLQLVQMAKASLK